jgi:hypothetical protein
MMTCHEAAAVLGNRDSRKIGNNTYLERIDANTVGIRLHGTIVVSIHNNGRYTLNGGGYRTRTTKDRINEYAPVKVYQKAFAWFVGDVPFFDGMEVDRTGKVLNAD